MNLNLTVDEVLTTTRAVRKRLDFDRPVPYEVIVECLNLALQAPTGSLGHWGNFVVVDDAEKKLALAEIYRKAWADYVNAPYSLYHLHKGDSKMEDHASRAAPSAEYLAEYYEKSPYIIMFTLAGRYDDAPNSGVAGLYGSVLPTVWSFMLAARERGLGTCWTTVHLAYEEEAPNGR